MIFTARVAVRIASCILAKLAFHSLRQADEGNAELTQ